MIRINLEEQLTHKRNLLYTKYITIFKFLAVLQIVSWHGYPIIRDYKVKVIQKIINNYKRLKGKKIKVQRYILKD